MPPSFNAKTQNAAVRAICQSDNFRPTLRAALDPGNKAETVARLAENLKLTHDVAERTYRLLADPAFGFTPDAKFDSEGFRNTLAVRAEIEAKPGSRPADPEQYVDLSYYQRAINTLRR